MLTFSEGLKKYNNETTELIDLRVFSQFTSKSRDRIIVSILK